MAAEGVACLTCALAAHEVLALGLVGVDSGDGHIIGSVWIQVLQDQRGLITV